MSQVSDLDPEAEAVLHLDTFRASRRRLRAGSDADVTDVTDVSTVITVTTMTTMAAVTNRDGTSNVTCVSVPFSIPFKYRTVNRVPLRILAWVTASVQFRSNH